MAVSKEDLFYAAFMARVVYGEEAIPAGYRGPTDDRNDDDYRGYLAREGWQIITDPSSSHFTANGLYDKVSSNGLLARKGDTLVLAFRGTDNKWSAVALGEAWSATGMRFHYDNFNELISLAFSYASNPANGINHVLVTGHSLGGSMADMFTVLDGTRFLNIPGVSLSVVSIASAGLDPYALSDYANSIDSNIAIFRNGKLIKLKSPSWYEGIYHERDIVHFPILDIKVFLVLESNIKFDDGIDIILPNISNDDTDLIITLGAHHNMGIYYENISEISNSELYDKFVSGDYKVVMGVDIYNFSPDFNGPSEHDTGLRQLKAPYGILDDPVFFLGMAGDDTINAWGRNDLIDGGGGTDTVVYKRDFEHYTFSYENGILSVEALYDPEFPVYLNEKDYLVDVEYLQFSDRTVSVADLTAGLVGGTPTDGSEVPADEVDNVAESIPSASSGDVNTITGSREDDYLRGTGSRDVIQGLEGDDILTGYSGQDSFDGGPGSDTVDYSYNPSDVSGIVDLAAGTADFTASGFYVESLTSIENVWMGAGNDILIGTDGPNDLRGGPGNDRIIPGGGNDVVYGDWKYSDQGGNDTVVLNYAFNSGYTVTGTPDALHVVGAQGDDWFYDIENFEFSDGIVKTANEVLNGIDNFIPLSIDTEFIVNTSLPNAQSYPSVATLLDGSVVVVWSERQEYYPWGDKNVIKSQIFGSDMTRIGSEFLINSADSLPKTEPNVAALASGGFVVIWASRDISGFASHDPIYMRIFDDAANPVTDAFVVASDTSGFIYPQGHVAGLKNGDIIVSYLNASNNVLIPEAKIYDSDGQLIAKITLFDEEVHFTPKVASLENGGFVAVSQRSSASIIAQLYDSYGIKIGNEINIQSPSVGSQGIELSVIGLKGGGFAVAWWGGAYEFSDIFVQVFDDLGNQIGERKTLSSSEAGWDRSGDPTLSALENGDFVVIWENSNNTDSRLLGQVFDARGNQRGKIFSIEATSDDQYSPTASFLNGEKFIVTWEGLNVVGDNFPSEIYARVYNASNLPIPPKAHPDAFLVSESLSVNGNLLADNGNGSDVDPDGTYLIVSAINGQDANVGQQIALPSGALLTVNVDGRFTYNPNGVFDYLDEGETATDSFTYTVADAQGATDTATVTITIEGEINPVDITGDDTDQNYTGTPKDDHINGLGGNDVITGGAGYDWLQGGDGQDQIYGGEGNDWLEGGSGPDTLDGGAGQDVLIAGDGDDHVIAGAGDDRLIAGSGAGDDSYDGGAGVDTIVFSSTHQGVSVDLLAGTASGAEIGSDTLFRIENVIGGDGADTIRGSAAPNVIRGGGLGDVIFGGRGADELHGDVGIDELHGGLGNDTLYGGDQPDTLWGDANSDSLYGGNGNDILYGGAQADLLRGGNDSDILWGGNGNDTLYGEAQADTLHGGNDDDLLLGGAGNDTLYGEAQNDTLHGGMNDDVLWGGNGNDVLYGGAQNDILHGGNEDDALWGGEGNDTLYGEARNDVLRGGRGVDVLWGGGGLDMLHGGAQDDVLHGGFENDQLWGDEGNDTLYGEAQNDILHGGMNDDRLWGGGGDDRLYGDEQNDWLYGGLNNDFLDGGPGDDVLYGGGQADIFYYGQAYGADEIRDFQNNVDKIDLSAFGFASVTQALSHASVVDVNVVFDFGGGHTLTVYNANLGQIQNDLII